MHRLLAPLFLAATLLAACDLPHSPTVARPTPIVHAQAPSSLPFINAHAVIIIRHADISTEEKARLGNATPLLPRGTARSQELITALQNAGITRIITSSSLRTRQTADPLAASLHLTPETALSHGPETRPAGSPPLTYAQSIQNEAADLISYAAAHATPNDNVLVVYHHSIIPAIMKNLGYDEGPINDESEFDRVYVLLPDAQTHTYQLLRLRYGGTWPAPTTTH